MRVITALRRTMGAAMGIQVLSGVAFWAGYLAPYVGVHRLIGTVYVLLLWTIAAIALRHRRATAPAVFALAWGVVIAGFGFAQQEILVGDYHWVVRVLHLAIGWAAMPIVGLIERSFAVAERA